jgi:hypothetical protein
MNITLQLQELDDLIVANTKPPTTTILRNKLSALREQMEAYIETKEKETADAVEVKKAYTALKAAQPVEPPTTKPALPQNATVALVHICNSQRTVPVAEIAQLLKCDQPSAQYCCDTLVDSGFIEFNTTALWSRMNPKPTGYTITKIGRKFVMENPAG